MPELPEVHTISADLNKHISGCTIKKVVVAKTYNIKPTADEFVKNVTGKKVKDVKRVAKNIVINFETNDSIIIHLAMTGQVLLRESTVKTDKWVKAVFVLDNGKNLIFTDMRSFGKLAYAKDSDLADLYKKYGPEPLDDGLTAQEFLNILQKKKTTIKNALLEQSLVAGIGNIYANDALFLSNIHPETLTIKLNKQSADKLLTALRTILKEGIDHRGSTLPDKMYVDIFGNPGTQQNYFRIFMKKQCPICGTKIEIKSINGRGSYICPNCQKLK
jgi:formamidopyrimidine-DNA glycosylase